MPKQRLLRDTPGTPEYIHRQEMKKKYNAKRSEKSRKHQCTHLCRHSDRDIVKKKDILMKKMMKKVKKPKSEDIQHFLLLWRKCFVHRCNYLLQHNPAYWQPIADYLHYDTQYCQGEKEVNEYLKTKFDNIDNI